MTLKKQGEVGKKRKACFWYAMGSCGLLPRRCEIEQLRFFFLDYLRAGVYFVFVIDFSEDTGRGEGRD